MESTLHAFDITWRLDKPYLVIASEAKQSILLFQASKMDCHVALLLAMTGQTDYLGNKIAAT